MSKDRKDWETPDGLADMLRDFTVAVFKEEPEDLLNFAIKHFSEMQRMRQKEQWESINVVGKESITSRKENVDNQSIQSVTFKAEDNKGSIESIPKAPFEIQYIGKDEEGEHVPMTPISPRPYKQTQGYRRRQSVSAERYDPEQDTDDHKVVHPKSDEQRKRLNDAVKGILLFRDLDQEEMNDVINAMFERKVSEGEEVITLGADGDNFYIVESGTYEVFVEAGQLVKRVCTFKDEGSFGELALLYNQPRAATVIAATNGVLWAMDRNSFRHIVLRSAFKKRKMYEEFLESVSILSELSSFERVNLADAFTPRYFKGGEAIIREGDNADGMYFIEEGNARVTIRSHGKEIDVKNKEMGKGSYFGELALVEHTPRSATVYAVGNVKLAFIDRNAFERLLGPCVDIMKRNMANYEISSN